MDVSSDEGSQKKKKAETVAITKNQKIYQKQKMLLKNKKKELLL